MKQIRVVITLEVPDGATVGVGESFAGETVPPGPEPVPGELESLAAQPVAPVAQAVGQTRPVCPIHHDSKWVPAGISKKTGNAYSPFYGCKERSCNWTQPA